jgi:hypothetical protein
LRPGVIAHGLRGTQLAVHVEGGRHHALQTPGDIMRLVGFVAAAALLAAPRLALACGGGGSGYSGGGGGVSGEDPYSDCIRWQPVDAGDSGITDGGTDAGLVCVEPATYSVAMGCSSAQGVAAPLAILFALTAFRPRRRAHAEVLR